MQFVALPIAPAICHLNHTHAFQRTMLVQRATATCHVRLDRQAQLGTYSSFLSFRIIIHGFKNLPCLFAVLATLAGCAHQEEFRALDVPKVNTAARPYNGTRMPVAVGKFDNRSSYLRGVFTDNIDRLGSQAQTVLITHLQQSNRFNVLDRTNMGELKEEAAIMKKAQAIKGTDFVLTGDVTEFGRKDVGDRQLFGILGRGKTQVAYAKVSLNVINTMTSEVVYSVQGAGEYSLSEREIIGFGGTAGYDSTLNGKVLDLAIREAVQKLVVGIDSGAWRPVQ